MYYSTSDDQISDDESYYLFQKLSIDPNTRKEELERMMKSLHDNLYKTENELRGLSWHLQDPGRQWTSSFHPTNHRVEDFYGQYYHPFTLGLDPKIETLLRLGRLDPSSPLSRLPKEILTQIMINVISYS